MFKNTEYTLYYCTFGKGQRQLIKTTDYAEVEKLLNEQYPDREELKTMSAQRKFNYANKLDYLQLISTPHQKHSYTTEYSIGTLGLTDEG